MTLNKSKRKPTKAQRFAAIRAMRGILRPKSGEPSFAESIAKWKAEDRALEMRRDDLLASMFKNKPLAADKLWVRLQRLKARVPRK